jgi:hypothetical protein
VLARELTRRTLSGFFAPRSFSHGSAAVDHGACHGRSPNQTRADSMRMKWFLAIAVIAGLIGTGVAFSQNSPAPAATSTEKVKTISKREWNRMKGQWAKQTEKWASCNKQSDDQKLTGRKSWSFVASCMTS